MTISVIIPTYNRSEVLRRTLNLLATQTLDHSEFEVIVVNDGSRDDTERLLKEFEEKNVFDLKVFKQENSGQGVARNKGIDVAKGEILIFLGDDMLPKPDLLEQHFRFHAAYPEINKAALGTVEWHPEITITGFMRWLTRSGVQFKFHDLKKGQATDFRRFYTSNISLKRELLGKERFDLDFHGWGFEDTELGYRLQKKGMELIYWPEALVHHYHVIDASSLKKRQFSAGQNAVKLQQKHPDVDLLPKGGKLLVQKIIATLFPFTYYGKAKSAFLKGISSAKREKS